MLVVSPELAGAFERRDEEAFAKRMLRWLGTQLPRGPAVDLRWCHETIAIARRYGIRDEVDVAEFGYVRAFAGDGLLALAPAMEILNSERSGELKVFQLRAIANSARG